jgi:hypothetical protein
VTQEPQLSLAERIVLRQEGAEADFLARFEQRVFCLCLARLGDRLRAQRWTAALLEECLAKLHSLGSGTPALDDTELALFVSRHCRGRAMAAATTGDPAPSLLRPIDLGALLRGQSFHRTVLDAMQTTDKRLLYRSITQRMSPEEIGADLEMEVSSVAERGVAAVERALQVMREEIAAHEARSKARSSEAG